MADGNNYQQQPGGWRPDVLTQWIAKVSELEKRMEHFVTEDEFRPIRMIVYGLVGLILMTVFGVMLGRVVTK